MQSPPRALGGAAGLAHLRARRGGREASAYHRLAAELGARPDVQRAARWSLGLERGGETERMARVAGSRTASSPPGPAAAER